MTLNLLRWTIALLILLPLGRAAVRGRQRRAGALAPLRAARPARRRPVQLAAIPGAAKLDADQRDPGGLRHAGLDAAGRAACSSARRSARARSAAPCCRSPACWWCCAAATLHQLLALRLVAGDLYMILATDRLVVLQLDADCSQDDARRCAPTGPPSCWPRWLRRAVVGRLCRRRMGAGRRRHRLELAAWPPPCCTSRSARPSSPCAAGAPACSAPGPSSAPSSST